MHHFLVASDGRGGITSTVDEVQGFAMRRSPALAKEDRVDSDGFWSSMQGRSNEECATLHKAFSNEWEDHQAVKYFRVAGQLVFRAWLLVPRGAPPGQLAQQEAQNGLVSCVRRAPSTEGIGQRAALQGLRTACSEATSPKSGVTSGSARALRSR